MSTPEQDVTKATALLQKNAAAEALALIRVVVETHPNNAAARHTMGLSLYILRRYTEAHEQLIQAVRLDGSNALHHHNLGEVLRRLKRPAEAAKAFEQATIVMPEFLKSHMGLGNAYRELNRFDEAISRYRLVLAINPRYAEAYVALATTYRQQERNDDALPMLRKAIALQPGNVEALLALASGLAEEDPEEAVDIYNRVLQMRPAHPAALNNLGNLLKTLGRMSEAVAVYEKAIAHNPDSASAWYNLSRSRKGVGGMDEINQLENIIAKPSLVEEQKVNLHFALGKLYDDVGQYDRAFQHFELGNALDSRGEQFNPEAHSGVVNRLIAVFNEQFITSRQGFGSETETPIFIVGMPRSGTTLTEQILASHSQVFGAGEQKLIGDMSVRLSANSSFGAYPENAMSLDVVKTISEAEGYVRRLRHLAGQRRPLRITDKMPGNFLHLGLIALLFPRARIIHCVREPLDTCLSCFSQYFTSVMPFTRSLTALGRYWQDYDRLAQHWHKVLPGRILDISYADMVADQEGTSRRLLDHCGLAWEDGVLDFHKTKRPVRTASTWQVRQPIYTSSVERWRNYQPYLEPLIESMGERYRSPIAATAPIAEAALPELAIAAPSDTAEDDSAGSRARKRRAKAVAVG